MDRRRGAWTRAGEEALGRGLAALHAAGAADFGAPPPGAPAPADAVAPLRIGELSLPNDPAPDWPSFYAERRLAPLVALCLERGTLSASGARAVERVCERIGDLAGPAEPPARLHGDLWGGNVLAGADGRARLIDPAAYGGHREVDLAMLRLFGAPSERVFAAYDEAAPLGRRPRASAWRCGSCSRCSCTPRCSAAPTARPSSARPCATSRDGGVMAVTIGPWTSGSTARCAW